MQPQPQPQRSAKLTLSTPWKCPPLDPEKKTTTKGLVDSPSHLANKGHYSITSRLSCGSWCTLCSRLLADHPTSASEPSRFASVIAATTRPSRVDTLLLVPRRSRADAFRPLIPSGRLRRRALYLDDVAHVPTSSGHARCSRARAKDPRPADHHRPEGQNHKTAVPSKVWT